MKCREFVFVGDPIPELTELEHAAFLLQFQKSVLTSLRKRELLTQSQYERCVQELEIQHAAIRILK